MGLLPPTENGASIQTSPVSPTRRAGQQAQGVIPAGMFPILTYNLLNLSSLLPRASPFGERSSVRRLPLLQRCRASITKVSAERSSPGCSRRRTAASIRAGPKTANPQLERGEAEISIQRRRKERGAAAGGGSKAPRGSRDTGGERGGGPGWHSPTPYFSRLVGIQRAMPAAASPTARLRAAVRPPPLRAASARAAPPCYGTSRQPLSTLQPPRCAERSRAERLGGGEKRGEADRIGCARPAPPRPGCAPC